MNEKLRKEILDKVKQYYDLVYKKRRFKVGKDYLNYSGYSGDYKELQNIVDCALRRWFTLGHYADTFSKKLCKFLKVNHCILTNSGSSANLLAITALTSPSILVNRLYPGDEIITTACCFPTTIAPIVQNRLCPVFVDISLETFNMIPEQVEQAITNRTKAIFLTHAFGNPVNMDSILSIAKKYGLWVISDCCDALGAKWDGKPVETLGDIATASFYPAHHITTGEGGAVFTNSEHLKRIIQSFRDWGRHCDCKPGEISKCNSRFRFKFGKLPYGYDHKYVFTHIGYNLKMDDINASIGSAQIDKLKSFIVKRNHNFNYLYEAFNNFKAVRLPKRELKAEPSWFAFPFTYYNRNHLMQYLEANRIQTRLVFAGNILNQPAYQYIEHRQINNLPNTNRAMNDSMFLGTYPGIRIPMMKYVIKKIKEYFNG